MDDFILYLKEILADFGPVTARRMFGGFGIYHDGLMFGLVAGDTLYLKADDESRRHFEQEGLPPFEYVKNGKPMKMSYYQAPDAMLDDPQEAAIWGQRAYQAALRQRK